MKLEQSFEVGAPLPEVWEALVDVERVAPCLPGAEVSEAGDDGIYRGSFSVKLGPTTASYNGELRMEEVDEPAHRAVMRASGQDKRGQGSARATIVSSLAPSGDATKVDVETDFTITGRLARFGRGGMIQDVSSRLLRDFAECLQRTIEEDRRTPAATAAEPGGEGLPGESVAERARPSPRPAKPLKGFSLILRALLDRLRRAFRRG